MKISPIFFNLAFFLMDEITFLTVLNFEGFEIDKTGFSWIFI